MQRTVAWHALLEAIIDFERQRHYEVDTLYLLKLPIMESRVYLFDCDEEELIPGTSVPGLEDDFSVFCQVLDQTNYPPFFTADYPP